MAASGRRHGNLDLACGVAVLVAEAWDELDADFQRFYGLDLAECCWGSGHLGVRRLWSLIRGLPPDSALARGRGWSWTHSEELAALLLEVTVNQFRQKGVSPFRYPRPGAPVEEAGPPPLTRGGLRAALLGGSLGV